MADSVAVLPPIGKAIRLAREGKGLTQAELAFDAGVGLEMIRGVESGATLPPFDKLVDIAWALRLSTSALLLEAEELVPHTTRRRCIRCQQERHIVTGRVCVACRAGDREIARAAVEIKAVCGVRDPADPARRWLDLWGDTLFAFGRIGSC